jgi:hypothetical protein
MALPAVLQLNYVLQELLGFDGSEFYVSGVKQAALSWKLAWCDADAKNLSHARKAADQC